MLICVHLCKDLLLTESSGILLPLEKRVGSSQNSVPWGKVIFRAEYVHNFQIVVLSTHMSQQSLYEKNAR